MGASDHEIEVAPGVAIAARFYAAGESHPTVLYFHGNGEVVSDHDGIAHFYHEVGLNLLVAEFRGYGKSGGRPAVAALVSDAIPAVEYATALLAEGGYDPRMFVMGRSLGSQPALEVAARASAHVRGLIIESATAKIRSIRLPALLIHGEADDLMPLEQAAGLYDLLEGTRRELVVIPGAGHNDILWIGRRQYFEAIRDFVVGAAG